MQTILYVEDDAGSRKVMQYLVRGGLQDCKLIMFEDSHDFMTRLQMLEQQPSVIMLDIHVEPITGFEMLQQLRENDAYKDLPILALTASVMNEEVQKLRRAGFSGVLAKPLDPDQFPDLFQRILNGEQIWNIV
jgi:CheY-like chemotaxis protein